MSATMSPREADGVAHTRRLSSLAALLLLCLGSLGAGCEAGERPEPPAAGQGPQWPPEELPEGTEAPEPTTVASRTEPVAPPEQPETEARPEPPVVPPHRISTRSLKERFDPGARLRREVLIEQHYRVRVQSGLAATAEGGTETRRAYTVEVEDSVGGQIVSANIDIEEDTRQPLPGGQRARTAAVDSGLAGLRLHCQLMADGGYRCEPPGSPPDESLDLTGIIPQRPGMLPGRPASAGDTWNIEGREAELFLGIPGVEATVHFTFDDPDALYREMSCYHVSYVLEGTQPVTLMSQTLPATLSGQGEYYYCRDVAAVLHHRQDRELNLVGPVIRRGNATPIERNEQIVFQEDTFLSVQ